MKAMILAAGRGERLRPLTDHCPKPLLAIGEDSLISRHIKRLKAANFSDIVINHAWLGAQIEASLGNGAQFGVNITYSAEPEGGLETAGGIATALPLLGDEAFLVVNGDLYTDFDFTLAYQQANKINAGQYLAHLWLVENPDHHPDGDFSLSSDGLAQLKSPALQSYTFSGIALYHADFFKDTAKNSRIKLAPLLIKGISQQQISAEIMQQNWLDVGTIERLDLAIKRAHLARSII